MDTLNAAAKPMTATEPAAPDQARSDFRALPRLLLAMKRSFSQTVHIMMSTARTTTAATACAATAATTATTATTTTPLLLLY